MATNRSLLESALVIYRSLCDKRDGGEAIDRAQFVAAVDLAVDAAVLNFPTLAVAPRAHVHQKTVTLEAASLMLQGVRR